MHCPAVFGKEVGNQGVIIQKRLRKLNKRASTSRQRKRQHLLDVKVRAKKVAARRTQSVLLTVCGFILIASVLGGIAFGAKRTLNALFFEEITVRGVYAQRLVKSGFKWGRSDRLAFKVFPGGKR